MITENLLAGRTARMGASAIREILKVVSRPGMVSLAGGIPSPQAFPMELMAELTASVLERHGETAFQYGTTEGYMPLREALVGYLHTLGIESTAEKINITSGSQGTLDGIAKILISPGDVIAVEAPTYLGALQSFNPYEPTYAQIETDADGVIPESMEEVIRKSRPKMVYLVPTFQNPTGRTIPLERRKQIAQIAIRTNTLVIEDDPYGQLRYEGEFISPIYPFAPDHVIYCGTMSKVFSPGLRVGFNLAPALLAEWMVKAKQGVDLHTSSFSQALAAEFLNGGHLARHIPKIIDLYKPRLNALVQAMEESLPDTYTWIKPDGGMFVWAEGPEDLDAVALYAVATQHYNVAYVPGTYFYAKPGSGKNTMRLNFTMADEATLKSAVGKLGEAIRTT